MEGTMEVNTQVTFGERSGIFWDKLRDHRAPTPPTAGDGPEHLGNI